jgi:hypothetical protein
MQPRCSSVIGYVITDSGSIDFDSGQISLTWNVNNPGSTYLVVSYEYPRDNDFI